MKLKLLMVGAFAAAGLSGCVTYDHAGANAPGGYYQGRPQVRYHDAYGYPVSPYYGGYYGNPYYYGRNPYYGYYGPYYPYYPPAPPPPRPGHTPPPGSGPGGSRPAPWRDPTQGVWREHGQQPMVPGQAPAPQPAGARPLPRIRPPTSGRPPRISNPAPGSSTSPGAMPRSPEQRPAGVPRIQPRAGGRVKVVEP